MATSIKKVVIVGDGSCGKTSIVRRFAQHLSPEGSLPTTSDFYTMNIDVRGRPRTIMICDAAGTEQWAYIRKDTYAGARVVILTFDLSDKGTLENVLFEWGPEVRNHCPGVPCVLVGNKLDLRDKTPHSVDEEKGDYVAGLISAKHYLECSALTGEGIVQLFDLVGNIVFSSRLCTIL